MKRYAWHIGVGAALVGASGGIYLLQVWVFRRADETLFYMLQDLAFVPVQVLVVTLIINALLQRREKMQLQRKMNMVIGSFFSEAGTDLMRLLGEFETRPEETARVLQLRTGWSDREFAEADRALQGREFGMDCHRASLEELKRFLLDKRGFVLTLLENPNLLEHELFTDLLWAVCHLTEELWHRKEFVGLHTADYAHLANDIQRAYALLIRQWLSYARHLKADYPYIFSLTVRTNPFDREASVELTS